MAKINFEMDTTDKTYTLTLDGEPIDDVLSLSAYMYSLPNDSDGDGDDTCSICITTQSRDDEERICHLTEIRASEKGVEKKETTKPIAKPVVQHISTFLEQNRQRR